MSTTTEDTPPSSSSLPPEHLNQDVVPSTVRWYVVNVFSGSEERVIREIREKAEKKGLDKHFFDLIAPKQELTEVKRGVKKQVKRTFFPGYVLVRMDLTDETSHLVRNIDRVAGFLGGKERPSPVSQREVDHILGTVEASKEEAVSLASFTVGESVHITEGPFASFSGLVEDIEEDKQKLKVSVAIFGRPTPVELNFDQVEKKEG